VDDKGRQISVANADIIRIYLLLEDLNYFFHDQYHFAEPGSYLEGFRPQLKYVREWVLPSYLGGDLEATCDPSCD
jgi:hypothetical protein